jgi:hypothetical protein
MSKPEKSEKVVFVEAVRAAIMQMGMERFKDTSFFIRNWKEEELKQAA